MGTTLNRHRYYLNFILASLSRRKWKNVSLLIIYCLVVFLIASVAFFASAIRHEARLLLQDSPELIVQRTIAGRHAMIPEDYARHILSLRGVQKATPRYWGYYFHPASGANYTLMAPENFTHGDKMATIGNGVLQSWGTVQDNQLVFKSASGEPVILSIAESFPGQTDLVAADLILMAREPFRQITGVPAGWATDLAVTVRNTREVGTIAEKIAQRLPDSRPILKSEITRTYTAVFHWRSGYIIILLSGTLLAFIIFAWDKATGLSAAERTEIGILKGLGWDTGDILMIKFWEGLVISLTAFFIGIIAAYGHVFFASAGLFAHALKGWSVLYPEFHLRPVVSTYQLAVLMALTVLPYTFMTIVPAWRAASMDPDRVMTGI